MDVQEDDDDSDADDENYICRRRKKNNSSCSWIFFIKTKKWTLRKFDNDDDVEIHISRQKHICTQIHKYT